MSDPFPEMPPAANAASAASAALARAGAVAPPTVPILRQLLARERDGLFGDAIIARTSAMIGHLAHHLGFALAQARGEAEPLAFARAHADELAEKLTQQGDVLGHVHALAVESFLAELLHERAAIDPALSSVLKVLLASEDAEISAAAMHVLAAQARFLHHSRRMELPLGELPGELFHLALSALDTMAGSEAGQRDAARSMLAAQYDEGSARASQIARLLMLTEDDAAGKPSLADCGLAIFASWLAQNAGKRREDAVLAIAQQDHSRLALMMRAADLPVAAMQQVIATIDPHGQLDEKLASLAPDEARQLLRRGHDGAEA